MKQLSKQTKDGYLVARVTTEDGHFSLTGNVWKTESRNDRDYVMGGRIHEEILKAFPNLQPIVDLHLSDLNGVPMHAVEGGFYFLQIVKGVGKYHNYKEGDEVEYLQVLKEHLRCSDSDLDTISKEYAKYDNEVEQKAAFYRIVESMKPRWKAEAEAALKLIESLD